MENKKVSADRLRLNDHKKYLGCCTFVVVGLSLFHMGFEWVGWGVMVAAWACWIAVLVAASRRDAIDGEGGAMEKPRGAPYYLLAVCGVVWLLCGWGLAGEHPALGAAFWSAGAVVTGFVVGWYAKGRR